MGDGFQVLCGSEDEQLYLTPLEGSDRGIKLLTADEANQYRELTYFTLEIAAPPPPDNLDEHSAELEQAVSQQFLKDSYGSAVFNEERYCLKHLSSQQYLTFVLKHEENLHSDHWEVRLADFSGVNSTLRVSTPKFVNRAAVQYSEGLKLNFHLEGVDYFLSPAEDRSLRVSTKPALWQLEKTIDFATDAQAVSPFIPVTFSHPEMRFFVTVLKPVFWHDREGNSSSLLSLSEPMLGFENLWFLDAAERVATLSWGSEVFVRNAFTKEFICADSGDTEVLSLRLSATERTAFRLVPTKEQKSPKIPSEGLVVLMHRDYYVAVGTEGLTQYRCAGLASSKYQHDSISEQGINLVLKKTDLRQLDSAFCVAVATREVAQLYYQLLTDVTALQTFAKQEVRPQLSTGRLLADVGVSMNTVLRNYIKRMGVISKLNQVAHTSTSDYLENFNKAICAFGVPVILMKTAKALSRFSWIAREQISHYAGLIGSLLKSLVQNNPACCAMVMQHADLLLDFFHHRWVGDVLACAMKFSRLSEIPETFQFRSLLALVHEGSLERKTCVLQLLSKLFKHSCVLQSDIQHFASHYAEVFATLWVLRAGLKVCDLSSNTERNIKELSSSEIAFLCRTLRLMSYFVRCWEHSKDVIERPPYSLTADVLQSTCLSSETPMALRREALSLYLSLQPEERGMLESAVLLPNYQQNFTFLNSMCSSVLGHVQILSEQYTASGMVMPTLKSLSHALRLLNLLLVCEGEYPLLPLSSMLNAILHGFDTEAQGVAITQVLKSAVCALATNNSNFVLKILNMKSIRKVISGLAQQESVSQLPLTGRSTDDIVLEIEEKFRDVIMQKFKRVLDASGDFSEISALKKLVLDKALRKQTNDSWSKVERQREVEGLLRSWMQDRFEAKAATRRFRMQSLCTKIARATVRAYYRLSKHYHKMLVAKEQDCDSLLQFFKNPELKAHLRLHYKNFWMIAMNPRVTNMRRPTMTELFEEAFELQAVVTRKIADSLQLMEISHFRNVSKCARTLRYYTHCALPSGECPEVVDAIQSLLSFSPLPDMRTSSELLSAQKLWKGCLVHTLVLRILANSPRRITPLVYYCTLFLWAFCLNNAESLRLVTAALKPEAEMFKMHHYAELFLCAWRTTGRGWESLHQVAQFMIARSPDFVPLIDLSFKGDFRGYKVLEQYCFYRALEKDPLTDVRYVTALSCLYSLGRSQLFASELSVPRVLSCVRQCSLSLSLVEAYIRLITKIIDENNVWEAQEETLESLNSVWDGVSTLLRETGELLDLGQSNCYDCLHRSGRGCEVWLTQLQPDQPILREVWESLFSQKFYWASSGLVLAISKLLSLDRSQNAEVIRLRDRMAADLATLQTWLKGLPLELTAAPLLSLIDECLRVLQSVGQFRSFSAYVEAPTPRQHSSLPADVLSKVIKINFKTEQKLASDAEVALKLKSALYHTRRALYFSALRHRIKEIKRKERAIVFNDVGFSTAAEMAVDSITKATDSEVKIEALTFLTCLVRELSTDMVLDFKEMLEKKKIGVPFAKQLCRDLEDLVIIIREQEIRQDLISDKVSECVEVLRLLQCSARNCNAPVQEYVRTVGAPDINLLVACGQVVEAFALEHVDTMLPAFQELIPCALQTLLELVAGPCPENQRILGTNPVLMLGVSRLLGDAVRSDSPHLLICSELLLALVEGSEEFISDVKKTIAEYLNFDPVFTLLEAQGAFLSDNLRKLELGAVVEKADEKVTTMIRLFILLLKLSDRPTLAERLKRVSPPVLDFLRKYTGHVEVKRDALIEKVYFPIAFDSFYLTEHSKNLLVFESDRMSQQAQLIDFLNSIPMLQVEMRYQQYLHYLLVKLLTRSWSAYGRISFFFVLLLNVAVLRFNREELLGQGQDFRHNLEMVVLGAVQIFFFLLYTTCYMIEYFPRLIRDHKTNFTALDYDSKEYQLKSHSLELTATPEMPRPDQLTITIWDEVKYFVTGRTTLYCVCYILCSVLAMKFPTIYPFLLLDGLQRFDGLRPIIRAITVNKFHLMLSFLMVLVVVYLFTMIAFVSISNNYDPGQQLYCGTLWECFATNLDVGTRNGGGIGNVLPTATADDYWIRLFYDTFFYIIVIVILQNVTFGIIIDTYADMRNQEIRLMEDVYASCFICGVTRGKLELRGENFLTHISDQHNVFNYICYIIYLKKKRCSGVEAAIKAQIEHFDTGFFPLDREAE